MKTVYINNNPVKLYEDGAVGISVSGGADSALLLYILMSNLSNPIKIYTMFAPERREAMEPHVDLIVKTCSELTGNTNYTYHKDFVHRQSPEILFKLLTEKLDSKEVDIMYVGLTKFPPHSVWKDFPDQQPEWHNKFRADDIIRPLYGISIPIEKDTNTDDLTIDSKPTTKSEISIDERAYVPFVNLNKKDLAAMYKELEIEQVLFTKTRSCEDATHHKKHCGKCWWCHERNWAFGYLE